jgi:hypothetical protein
LRTRSASPGTRAGNLRIDWRWTGDDAALIERYSTELVSLSRNVIVVYGSLSVAVLRLLQNEFCNTIGGKAEVAPQPLEIWHARRRGLFQQNWPRADI